MKLINETRLLTLVASVMMIFLPGCEPEPSGQVGRLDSGIFEKTTESTSIETSGKEDIQVRSNKHSSSLLCHPEPLGERDVQIPNKPGEEFGSAFSHVDRDLVDHLEAARELMSGKVKDVADAILELEKALYDDPTDYDSALMLGNIARSSKRIELATDAYMHCAQLDPDSAEPWIGLARLSLSQKQLDQAEQLVKRALLLNPRSSMATNIIGRIWLERSHWGRAISYLRKAVELSPENIHFVNNLGFAYLLSRDFQSAVETLEPISEKPGVRAFMLNNLGLAYEGLGRVHDATVLFKKAIERRPSYVNAKINLERIVQLAKSDRILSPGGELDRVDDRGQKEQSDDLIIGDDDSI